MDDELILAKLQEGNENAFAEIYNKYWKSLFVTAYNILKNKEVCEEIIQDVFVLIWNNREKISIKVSFKSYIHACVRYKVFAHFKKNKIPLRNELFESLDERFQNTNPESKLIHKELLFLIDNIVNSLPPKCKEVFKLSREQRLTHKEIAQKLNISVKTVENHISKAIKILRASLGYLAVLFLHNF